MTPSEIKQLTPDGYGGDFGLTMEVEVFRAEQRARIESDE